MASAPGLRPDLHALLGDRQISAQAAAFYLHPTIDLSTEIRATATDEATGRVDAHLRFQASVLNGVARVWAPRYRSLTLGTMRSQPTPETTRLAEQAYGDVATAFDRFLHESKDLPVFLLGHGQGAAHLVRLLKDRFDAQPLAGRLVAAYLAGELVGTDTFQALPPCTTPTATGCFASWATLDVHATPRFACGSEQFSRCLQVNTRRLPVACFNPVTGGPHPSPPAAHRGAGPGGGDLGGPFFDFFPGLVGAACDATGLLRIDARAEVQGVSAHDFAGSAEGDFHALDVHLFYLDLRADAAARLAAWAAKSP